MWVFAINTNPEKWIGIDWDLIVSIPATIQGGDGSIMVIGMGGLRVQCTQQNVTFACRYFTKYLSEISSWSNHIYFKAENDNM